MKGYKAFSKGLICRGKQYSENTVFKEDYAILGERGMHFCKTPKMVFGYYPLVNDDGELSEFAEVKALDEAITKAETVYVTKTLKIGKKLSVTDFVKACVLEDAYWCLSPFFLVEDGEIVTPLLNARIYAPCTNAVIKASNSNVIVSSSGANSQILLSGHLALVGSSGQGVFISSTGHSTKVCSSGEYALINISGADCQISSSGYQCQIDCSGVSARISSSGNACVITSSNDYAVINSSGDYVEIFSVGRGCKINSSGKAATIYCLGVNSLVKGKIGTTIIFSNWDILTSESVHKKVRLKSVVIDGERLKENVYYKMDDREICEVDSKGE